jgi:HlyD family secretion protein
MSITDSINSFALPNQPVSEVDKIRVILADDRRFVQKILYAYLEVQSDIEVIGVADSGQRALELVQDLCPDVALLDVEMPGMSGIATTWEIFQNFSTTKVLILSDRDDEVCIQSALKAGAKGYLLKNTLAGELAHAIRFVHQGYLQLGPGLYEKLSANSAIATTQKDDRSLVGEPHSLPLAVNPSQPNTYSLRQPSASESIERGWSSLTQELINTLPRVWTRGLFYLSILFIAVILPWSMLAKVDETGNAPGKIEPQGKALEVDAPVAGTVAELGVKEGQTVKAGQILLEFEPELSRAELQQAQARLEGQLNREAQLIAIHHQLEMAARTQLSQNQAQESEQLAQLSQIQQQLSSSRRVSILESDRLTIVRNQIERYRYLWKEGALPKSKVEETEDTILDRQRTLEQSLSAIQDSEAELIKQQSAYERIQHTGELALLDSKRQLREMEAQLFDIRSEIAQSQKSIQSLNFQVRQRFLRSPTNGVVLQIATGNTASVLQPGEPVVQIAPEQSPLVFRAQLPPSESGFIRLGMPVKLKFDAYPFQDFGIVEGQLKWISSDAKIVETSQGKQEVYEIEVSLDRMYIEARNKRVLLTPGQTGTAEVVIRQRRMIDFILDPFKKLQKGGLEM